MNLNYDVIFFVVVDLFKNTVFFEFFLKYCLIIRFHSFFE